MADIGFESVFATCTSHVGITVPNEEAIAHITEARTPFSDIVKGKGRITAMNFLTPFRAHVHVRRDGLMTCIGASSEDKAHMLLEAAAVSITGDGTSMRATFTFIGGRVDYRTGIPVDLSAVGMHAQACGPSNLPLFQSLHVNGRAVRVFNNGLLIVYSGTSVDDMKQTLLAACDIVHASDGDIN